MRNTAIQTMCGNGIQLEFIGIGAVLFYPRSIIGWKMEDDDDGECVWIDGVDLLYGTLLRDTKKKILIAKVYSCLLPIWLM